MTAPVGTHTNCEVVILPVSLRPRADCRPSRAVLVVVPKTPLTVPVKWPSALRARCRAATLALWAPEVRLVESVVYSGVELTKA
jgi:hypothetical protein